MKVFLKCFSSVLVCIQPLETVGGFKNVCIWRSQCMSAILLYAPTPPSSSLHHTFSTLLSPSRLSCSFFLLDSHYTRMTSSSTSVLGLKISQCVIFAFPSLSWFIWSCLSIEGLEIKLVVIHVTLVTCRLSLILWQQGNNDLAGFKTH